MDGSGVSIGIDRVVFCLLQKKIKIYIKIKTSSYFGFR